jgi:hypothetical protein
MNKDYIQQIKKENRAIQTTDNWEKCAIATILKEAGENCSVLLLDVNNDTIEYPYVKYDGIFQWSAFRDKLNDKVISFRDFMIDVHVPKVKKVVEIELNSEYSAKYIEGNEHITVGCQTIPLAIVRKFLNEIDSIKS